MTDLEYFSHPALSASKITQILRSPYDYFNDVKLESKSLDFGSIVHKLVLESNLDALLNGQKVVIEREFGDLRSKAAREEKEAFYAKHCNDYVVSKEAFECAKTLLESDLGAFFQYKGVREKPYFDKVLGREFKCKPDFFLENFKYGKDNVNLCIDLKTCVSNTEKGFTQSVMSYGYHIQAYVYSKILKADSFLFITIEKGTNNIACYYLDSAWFEKAESDIKEAFEILDNKEKYNKKVRVFKDENNELTLIKKLDMPLYLAKVY